MKCPQCGKELPRNSKFCQYCGSAIKQKSSSSKIIFLISLLVLSLISNMYLSYQYFKVTQQAISEKSSEEKKRHVAEQKATSLSTKLQEANDQIAKLSKRIDQHDFVSDLMAEDLDFYEDAIGFITPTGKKYHTIHCHYFKEANEYWAHNVEYCEDLGYTPCSECHKYR